MDATTIFKIVLTDLSLENSKLYLEMERTINSDTKIDDKIRTIKGILNNIVNNEAMITKFTQIMQSASNNETKSNTEKENG